MLADNKTVFGRVFGQMIEAMKLRGEGNKAKDMTILFRLCSIVCLSAACIHIAWPCQSQNEDCRKA